jgi:ParB family chromosome partitioning protein
VAAHPELVQIETAWRGPKEQKPGALVRGHFRELPNTESENPDADPITACTSTRNEIIVYGKGIGNTIAVDVRGAPTRTQAIASASAGNRYEFCR